MMLPEVGGTCMFYVCCPRGCWVLVTSS